MRNLMTSATAALAAATLLSAPAIASAESAPTFTYATTLRQTQPLPSGGVYTGSLRLTVASDGIVNGWYIPSDEGRFIAVTGGEQDGKFWLQVGDNGDFQIFGTVAKNGALNGSVTEQHAGPLDFDDMGFPVTFDFTATLQ
ncbi:MAG TPA: hypothetical protein VEJ20_07385 [Candidatus Eremiobacteraceae bacterium]|nr:hypothetical protein [Candidatus Eremiobacteraceae bacterium]